MSRAHAAAVLSIFNHFVENSFAAYPGTRAGKDAFTHWMDVIRDYPAFVARDPSGTVAGFAFLRPWHPADSLRRTAEITYFLHPDHRGAGLGTHLMKRLLEDARHRGIDRILASISSRNEESLAFHRKHGFTECGRFPEVGVKFGQPFDVIWMIRRLDTAD
jgi:phosphinothricin acetyltransferase